MLAKTSAQPRRGGLSQFQREELAGWLFAAPALLGLLVFTVIPMGVSLVLSLTDYSVFRDVTQFVGLDNYRQMMGTTDLYFWDALKATGVYAALNVPASILFSFAIALILNANIRGRAFFRTLFYLPSIVPAVATCMVWLWLLNPQFGLVNSLFKAVGLPVPGWLWDKATVIPTIVMIGLWNTGGTMVIFLAGLQSIPGVYYEALEVDGGNAWHRLTRITIPLITPTLFFNTIMAIIGSLQVFTQGYIMTDGGPGTASLFYVLYLFRQAFEKANMGYASALAWFLFVIILILTVIVFTTQKRWVYYEGE